MEDQGFLPQVEGITEGLLALGVRLGERAVVSGVSPTAQQAADALKRITGLTPWHVVPGRVESATAQQVRDADVLVDASGDAIWWPVVMARLRRQGRVLLLIPAGEQVYAFDFYPYVHRSSLTVLVRRV